MNAAIVFPSDQISCYTVPKARNCLGEPDCKSTSYMQPCILVSNAAPQFSCFSPPAILLSFQAVPSFRINNYMIYFLLVLFLLGKAYRANFSGRPSLGQHSRSSTKFVAFVVPLQIQNTDGSASISWAMSLDGSFTRVMSAITKRFHFWSIKVILLFRYPAIPYSTFYSVPTVTLP